MSCTSPNGTSASAAAAVKIEMTGASANSPAIEVRGWNGSLVANLTISASGWNRPNGPTRVGP